METYWVILQDNDALIKLNEDASTEVMDEARWEHLQRGDGADMWVVGKLRMKSRPHMVIKCSWRTLNPASLSFQPMAGWCSIFLRLMRLSLSHLSGSGNLASMPLS